MDGLVRVLRSTHHTDPIGQEMYQALFQLDSRAAALLLKELAKSGLLFRWVMSCVAICPNECDAPLGECQGVFRSAHPVLARGGGLRRRAPSLLASKAEG